MRMVEQTRDALYLTLDQRFLDKLDVDTLVDAQAAKVGERL